LNRIYLCFVQATPNCALRVVAQWLGFAVRFVFICNLHVVDLCDMAFVFPHCIMQPLSVVCAVPKSRSAVLRKVCLPVKIGLYAYRIPHPFAGMSFNGPEWERGCAGAPLLLYQLSVVF